MQASWVYSEFRPEYFDYFWLLVRWCIVISQSGKDHQAPHATCKKLGESFMQPAGPLPDSEFSTGPWEVNGNGAPVLRARTRATSALMGVLGGKLIHLLSGSLHDHLQWGSKLGDSSSNQLELEPSWHHHIKKYELYNYHEHSRLHQKGTNTNSLNSSHQENLSLLSSYWPYLEAYHYYLVCRFFARTMTNLYS